MQTVRKKISFTMLTQPDFYVNVSDILSLSIYIFIFYNIFSIHPQI